MREGEELKVAEDFCLSKKIMGKNRFGRDRQFSFGTVGMLVVLHYKWFCIFYF